ncbi:hypothetical protein AX14_008740 [Amanita brunnescens Koide BX004]|nr:hypothetical protein AX14_008740 [Amanita brunnescens Koide BX004]
MSTVERKALAKDVMPAQHVVLKLRKIAYGLKNSPTVVTPHWRELCKMWKKKDKNLPRDVRTRWNSTYDMLEVAIDYRDVINHLCSEQDPGL